jgi:peptidyl-prolyl cis-trans isomerase SurA
MKRFVLFVLAMLVATPVVAERQLVDRIVAVVEDEAIFASDIQIAVRQYAVQQGRKSLTSDEQQELARQALQELINDKLIIAQAGRLGISIPFNEVEDRVNKAIDDNRKLLGGEEAFEQQLETEGFTLDELKKLYRTQIRNRMLVERVLQTEMKKEIGEASDAQLHKFYEEHKDEIPPRPEVVHLKTIFIGFQTSPAASRQAKEKIDGIYQKVLAGESFAELAEEYSDDPSGKNGGDLGFIDPKDLRDQTFAAAAESLSVGEVSRPVLTSYGYHLIKVTDKRESSDELRISHILVRVVPSEDDMTGVFESANEIHTELLAGAPFDSLANRYNTDANAGPGGDLGWLKVADLPEFFRDVLANLSPGDISQVLRESTGFRIVELIGREAERPYAYSEITQELRSMYRQEATSTMYADYVKGLRDKFTVDIKPQ